MGFPEKNPQGPRGYAFGGVDARLLDGGYTCNRCKARVTDLPCECHICGLALVSSPHIARAYHHLFPVKPFQEIHMTDLLSASYDPPVPKLIEDTSKSSCFGCLCDLKEENGVILRCNECKYQFCFECDLYIHENLHNCPGCECRLGLS